MAVGTALAGTPCRSHPKPMGRAAQAVDQHQLGKARWASPGRAQPKMMGRLERYIIRKPLRLNTPETPD